jgi:hypothetical protein
MLFIRSQLKCFGDCTDLGRVDISTRVVDLIHDFSTVAPDEQRATMDSKVFRTALVLILSGVRGSQRPPVTCARPQPIRRRSTREVHMPSDIGIPELVVS